MFWNSHYHYGQQELVMFSIVHCLRSVLTENLNVSVLTPPKLFPFLSYDLIGLLFGMKSLHFS